MLRTLLALAIAAASFGNPVDAAADTGFLARTDAASFRLMSYNPYWDAIFGTGIRRFNRSDEFERVLAAVQPDVVCLQEIDPDRATPAVVRIFATTIALPGGQQWYTARGADNIIVSRFPIVWSTGESVHGTGVYERGHALAFIDLPGGRPGGDVLVVGTHFPSGGSAQDILARTRHADALLARVRASLHDHPIPDDIPIVIAGDLNAYETDARRHLDTLILGDVAGGPMVDLLPVHNAAGGETWTWRDDTQRFEPYALDRILYSGSSLDARHSFVLNTSAMSDDELSRHGLEAADVALNLRRGEFDHLPLVVDLSLK